MRNTIKSIVCYFSEILTTLKSIDDSLKEIRKALRKDSYGDTYLTNKQYDRGDKW